MRFVPFKRFPTGRTDNKVVHHISVRILVIFNRLQVFRDNVSTTCYFDERSLTDMLVNQVGCIIRCGSGYGCSVNLNGFDDDYRVQNTCLPYSLFYTDNLCLVHVTPLFLLERNSIGGISVRKPSQLFTDAFFIDFYHHAINLVFSIKPVMKFLIKQQVHFLIVEFHYLFNQETDIRSNIMERSFQFFENA